jgi:hypothetical protein
LDLVDFCQREGILLKHLQTDKYQESVVVQPSTIAKSLKVLACNLDCHHVHAPFQSVHSFCWLTFQIVVTPSRLPVYIHCLDGGNNTGLLIMCLRKLQNWSLGAAAMEFGRYARDGTASAEEVYSVEKFREEIFLPPPGQPLPRWLWGGRRLTRHASIRIAYREEREDAAEQSHPTGTPAATLATLAALATPASAGFGANHNPGHQGHQKAAAEAQDCSQMPSATPTVGAQGATSVHSGLLSSSPRVSHANNAFASHSILNSPSALLVDQSSPVCSEAATSAPVESDSSSLGPVTNAELVSSSILETAPAPSPSSAASLRLRNAEGELVDLSVIDNDEDLLARKKLKRHLPWESKFWSFLF